jgi:hypothetical protein
MAHSERAQKDFNTIESVLNNYGFDESAVAEQLANTHPTLQQSFMRLAAEYIYIQSEKKHFDGRNEATGKACKNLAEVMKKEGMHFPFI